MIQLNVDQVLLIKLHDIALIPLHNFHALGLYLEILFHMR